MPRERKQRGSKHAQKRKLGREEEERKYIESQERDVLFYDRPKNPFGLLAREDENFFLEVYDEFKKDQWNDEDAKEAFMRNVLVEMKGKELKIATSQVGKFLEILLAQCPRSDFQRIMTVFKGHARELARHRFGSYTLEKIVGNVGVWVSREIEETAAVEDELDDQLEPLDKLFIDMVEELVHPEMHEYFTDPFASHVYQAILHTLNGHPDKNLAEGHTAKRKKAQHDVALVYQTPTTFHELPKNFLNTVKSWDLSLLQKLVFDKYAVPLLQTLIESDIPQKSKKKSRTKRESSRTLIHILLSDKEEKSKEQQNFVNQLLRDAVGSRVFETMLRVSPDETIEMLFAEYFKGHLYELSIDAAANFAVQRILERLTRPEDVSSAVGELLNNTRDLIVSSRVSVVAAMLDACSRTGTACTEARQWIHEQARMLPSATDNIWSTLMGLDDHVASEGKVKKDITIKSTETTANAERYPVSRFGALLAASLLRLPEDTDYRIIEDLCLLETSAVLFYITSPHTSHVVESMLFPNFPVSLRRKVLNHVLGSVVLLATDPAGSHVVDAGWNATQDIRHYRVKMAQEMAAQVDSVRSDFFGKRVWRNWNMDGFIGARFDWGREQGAHERSFAKTPVVKKKPWQNPGGESPFGGNLTKLKKHSSRIQN